MRRWNVIVAHRRFGKSVLAVNEAIKRVMTVSLENPRVAYIAPTYKMAKNIIWDYFKYYSRAIPGIKTNESELKIDYPNGGRIILLGAEDPDSLRGLYFDFVVFDEYSQQPSNIFTEIIRPSLSDRKGGALWIGTPKGSNEFRRLYDNATNDDWYRILLRASETKVIDSGELIDAQRSMSPDEYNQEYECSWVPSIRGSFYADSISDMRTEGRITNVPYEPTIPVHTVWDLGISDDMAIGFYQIAGQEPRMIDFYCSNGKALDHYIQYLKEKGYNYGKHFAPHDIRVRELATGKSRYEIAQQLGVTFDLIPNLPVQDGINAGRAILKRLWIDEKNNGYFMDALLQYKREWDESHGHFRDKPLHDWTSHAADVHRYFALVADQMRNETQAVKQFVPRFTY